MDYRWAIQTGILMAGHLAILTGFHLVTQMETQRDGHSVM